MSCFVVKEILELWDMLEQDKKQPHDYGTGILLSHSEVSLLDIIEQYPTANASRISSLLGITKGAVTQTCQKLTKKGLITTVQVEGNKKEKYFRLTPVGNETRDGYLHAHQEANQRLCEYFSSLEAENIDVIFSFLKHLKQCTPFCQFSCHSLTPHTNPHTKENQNHDRNAIEYSKSARCTGVGD